MKSAALNLLSGMLEEQQESLRPLLTHTIENIVTANLTTNLSLASSKTYEGLTRLT
jgi:hypothetical protein